VDPAEMAREQARQSQCRRRARRHELGGVAIVGVGAQAAVFEQRHLRRQLARALVGVVSLRVSTLLASTSGWSNGLMRSRLPATAVAISQRTNSPPTSKRF
jgi:hypothetical protein